LFQHSSIKESLKAPLPTYIYLFNDMLLLTKTSVSKFTRIPRLSIIKSIPLTGIQIGDLSQTNDPGTHMFFFFFCYFFFFVIFFYIFLFFFLKKKIYIYINNNNNKI